MKRAGLKRLLNFANAVREAGGGNPIDALMPSVPEDPHSCLIARNLNFACTVTGLDEHPDNDLWGMITDTPTALKIAKALKLKLWVWSERAWYDGVLGTRVAINASQYNEDIHSELQIVLPRDIGQVAADFDAWASGDVGDEYEEFTPYVEEAEQYARVELGLLDKEEVA